MDIFVSISAQQNVIYFATSGGGIKVYSEATDQVETFVNSTENLSGVAWDPEGQYLYFSRPTLPSRIYRANADGSQVEIVFSSSSCE